MCRRTAQQLKRYLQALFEPDEYVAYVTESFMAADRRRPAKGCWDRTAGQLIEELDACGGDVGKVMGDCARLTNAILLVFIVF